MVDLLQAAHMAAYGNTGLGRSLMASEKSLAGITSESLKAHAAKTLVTGNVVVAASGVDHQATQPMISLSML